MSESSTVIQELNAIEEIKQLKARYFRLIDLQCWSELRSLFTADAVLTFEFPEMQFTNPDEFVAGSRSALEGARSVHRGFMPEIQLTAQDQARAVWAMEDRVEMPPNAGPSWHGYGYYHDEYRSVKGQWRICALQLQRVRIDQVGLPAGDGAG
jgi:SnoaL-like domain